jgi:hypothetical protein
VVDRDDRDLARDVEREYRFGDLSARRPSAGQPTPAEAAYGKDAALLERHMGSETA